MFKAFGKIINYEVRSRKLWFGLVVCIMMMASGVLAAIWPTFGEHLGTLVAGYLGAFTTFATGNTVAKFGNKPEARGRYRPEDPTEVVCDD